MLVTMNKNGGKKSSGGNQAQDYLLGKEGELRKGARLLKGDPDATTEVINGLNFAKIYTSGTLAFAYNEGDKLSEQDKFDIIEKFESSLFPNIPIEQISGYWVEHTDKILRDEKTDEPILDANGREQKRLELNFIYANVELTSGKALPIYYHRNDVHLMSAYRDVINAEYGLIDPNAISQRQSLSIPKNLPKHKKEILENAHDLICAELSLGNINDRSDILKVLNEAGIQIASKPNNKYISLKDPDGGQNIRMKGEIYEQAFTVEKFSREHQSSEATQPGYSDADIADAKERLQYSVGKRAERFESRFFTSKPRPYPILREPKRPSATEIFDFDDTFGIDADDIADFLRDQELRDNKAARASADADYRSTGLSFSTTELRERTYNNDRADKQREPSASNYSAVRRKPRISKEHQNISKTSDINNSLFNTASHIRISSRLHADTKIERVENVSRYFSSNDGFSFNNIWNLGLDSTHQKSRGRINADSRADHQAELDRDKTRTQTRAAEADKSNAERLPSAERSIRDATNSISKFIETTRPAVESLQDYSRRRKESDNDREKADADREKFDSELKKSRDFGKKIGRLEQCIDVTSSINSQIAVIANKHLQEKQAQQQEQQRKIQAQQQEQQRKIQAQQQERLEPKPQQQAQQQAQPEPDRSTYRSPRP